MSPICFTAIFLAFHFHLYFIHGQYLDPDFSFAYTGSVPYTCIHHSSCGDIINITYPFRLNGDPENCGLPNYELYCNNNQTILSFEGEYDYLVKSIDYDNFTIRISNLGFEEGNCSSIPRNTVWNGYHDQYVRIPSNSYEKITYISCEKPVSSPFYLNTSDCISSDTKRYSYVLVDASLDFSELAISCEVDLVTATTLLRDTKKNFTYLDIHKELVYGLEISFIDPQCHHHCIGEKVQMFCRFYNNTFYFSCYGDNRDTGGFFYYPKWLSYTCNHHSSCGGEIIKITYPFRLIGDPEGCGEPKYELSCIKNQTILSLKEGDFAVKAINYTTFTIRVSDLGVEEGNYSSVPRYSVPRDDYIDTNYTAPYAPYDFRQQYEVGNSKYFAKIAYISCKNPVNSPFYLHLNASDCITAFGRGRRYCYLLVDLFYLTELDYSCVIDLVTPATLLRVRDATKNWTYVDIHKDLVYGFELSFDRVECRACTGKDHPPLHCYCQLNDNTLYIYEPFQQSSCILTHHRFLGFYHFNVYVGGSCSWRRMMTKYFNPYYLLVGYRPYLSYLLALIFGPRFLCGCPCFWAFVIYKWRRRHLSMDDSLEQFLQDQNNLMPIRYSYSQIKKMCRGFTEKLGEGGFGSVFKGKLASGQFVAIKRLTNPKADAQDFINEVATIGRIHHVNIIRLIGFCAEGSKRALVYEFMNKGSLDKYICSQPGYISLGWEKIYQICLGVARGIEYLHRGCDMQILHFDIKPHNVLLDKNFIPKVSDFGLAKSYATGTSIVSVTAARGTIGYIAPELIYKQIGGVSSKADVYSFGMLVMQMTGKKKKQNEIAASAEDSSKMYFPMWVYHEIVSGGRGGEIEEVEKIARKMVVVALWCIQIRPCDRPSMRKVIEMLEKKVENIELPPEPTFNIEEVPTENVEESTNPTQSSFTSIASTSESIALMVVAE